MAVTYQSCPTAMPGHVFYSNHHRRRNPSRNYFPISTAPPPAARAAASLKVFAYNMRKSDYFSNKFKPKSLLPIPPIIKKNILKASLYAAVANVLFFLLEGGGGGSNNAGTLVSGGGGGGGKAGNVLSRILSWLKSEEEGGELYRVGSPVYMLGRLKKYNVSDVLFFDRRLGSFTDPAEDPLHKFVSIRPGEIYTRSQLQKAFDNLMNSGLFEEVDIDCKRNKDGSLRIRISFLERIWPKTADSFQCINVGMMPPWNPTITGEKDENPDWPRKGEQLLGHIKDGFQAEYDRRVETARSRPCLLPMSVQGEISDVLRERKEKNIEGVSARLLVKLREKVQYWYDDNGYACAQVVSFGNLNKGALVFEVAEGDITQVQFEDKLKDGNDYSDELGAVLETMELPHGVRKGEKFKIEAAEHAKLLIDSLGPFTNTELDLDLDKENAGGVIVKFKLEKKEEDSGGDKIEIKDKSFF